MELAATKLLLLKFNFGILLQPLCFHIDIMRNGMLHQDKHNQVMNHKIGNDNRCRNIKGFMFFEMFFHSS